VRPLIVVGNYDNDYETTIWMPISSVLSTRQRVSPHFYRSP
jgi:hypothetical protein